MSTPRFTDDEVRAIFERAAARQAATHDAEDAAGRSLSLEELQEIGAAAGIDPAHVAAAALELQAGAPAGERTTMLGMPVVIHHTRYVPAPVSDAVWERMVTDLRRTFDAAGIAGEVGRQREWTTTAGGHRTSAPVRVGVEPQGDGVRLTIEQSLRRSALPFLIGGAVYSAVAVLFGILFATGAMEGDGAFVPVMFAAMALLMGGGAQVGFRLYAARQDRRFEAALDRLERIARDATPEAETAEARPALEPETRRPALGLDALDEPAPNAAPEPRRDRTRS